MNPDIIFLYDCMDILENNSESDIKKIHNKLKVYTPHGMDDTFCDIIYYKAWESCPDNEIYNPSSMTIRKCDMLFCRMLVAKL